MVTLVYFKWFSDPACLLQPYRWKMDTRSSQTAPLASLATPPPPPSTPKRQKHLDISRDKRIEIYTLSEKAGWTPRRIAKALNISVTQVYYSLSHRFTPQKRRSGRKSIIDTPHRKRLIEFVTSSKRTRRMRFIDVANELGWGVSESAIRRALAKEGMRIWWFLCLIPTIN